MGGYPALSSTKFISEYVWLQWLRDVLSKSFISSDARKQNTALTSSIHVESLGSRGGYTPPDGLVQASPTRRSVVINHKSVETSRPLNIE